MQRGQAKASLGGAELVRGEMSSCTWQAGGLVGKGGDEGKGVA